MGYYTDFSLEVKGSGPVYKEFMKTGISESFGSYNVPPSYIMNGDMCEVKWYEHDEDMKALSLKWPNLLFILSGEGEESGDLWRTYYRNGKSATATVKITYDEPDLDKELPLIPGVEEKIVAEKVAEIEAEIARLEQERNQLTSRS